MDYKKIPNILTSGRLLLVPVFAYFLFVDHRTTSGIIFCLAAATDALDGYLARRLDAMSELGKIIDPIADHTLMDIAMLLMVKNNLLPVWALVFLVRDLVLFVTIFGLRKKITLEITKTAKLGTAVIMSSVALILLFNPAWGVWLFILGFAIALCSMMQYSRAIYQMSKTAISG